MNRALRVTLRARQDRKGVLPVQEGNPTAGLYQHKFKAGGATPRRLDELVIEVAP